MSVIAVMGCPELIRGLLQDRQSSVTRWFHSTICSHVASVSRSRQQRFFRLRHFASVIAAGE
jgi:hypothetical protein